VVSKKDDKNYYYITIKFLQGAVRREAQVENLHCGTVL